LSYAMTPLCGGSTTERIIMAIDSFNSREQPDHTRFARPDARARSHHDPTSLEFSRRLADARNLFNLAAEM